VSLTDFVFENPQGDFGTVELAVGDTVVFHLALENFRTNDFHFVSPIRATQRQTITMTVRCRVVGRPPGLEPAPRTCATTAYLGGRTTRLAPTPRPTPTRTSSPSPSSG
jgi:hypothetical protein